MSLLVLRAQDVHCPACPRSGPCVAAKARKVGDWLHVEGYPGGCPYLSGALKPGEPLPQDRRALPPPVETPPHRVDGFAAAVAREERRGYR
jgi:hypothetical protein